MSKFGSADGWFLLGGYNMIANSLQGLRMKLEALVEPTHGIGDAWEENTPCGVSRAEVAQEGAFFEDTALYIHDMLSTTGVATASTDSPRVVCLGFEGNTTGNEFVGMKGEYEQDFEILSQRGKLTRANATYVVTGDAENGKIIRPLTTTTGSVTSYLDNAVATTNGGSTYVQVTAITNLVSTGITITVSDSAASSGAFVAIGTVTTTGVGAWRVATTDNTVSRWLSGAVAVSTSGCPSLTCFIGYSRL